MSLKAEEINREFRDGMRALMKKHGKYRVPKDDEIVLSEVYRAKHACLAAGLDRLDPLVMQQYSIMGRVIKDLCGEIPENERVLKYADRRRRMEDWCRENIDAVITPNELAEIGDVSYATAIKFINERVDLFRKVERGKYLVRNLREERG